MTHSTSLHISPYVYQPIAIFDQPHSSCFATSNNRAQALATSVSENNTASARGRSIKVIQKTNHTFTINPILQSGCSSTTPSIVHDVSKVILATAFGAFTFATSYLAIQKARPEIIKDGFDALSKLLFIFQK